jgi:predicted PurR-regulated permease PerM
MANLGSRRRSQVTPRTIWTVGLHLLLIWTLLTILRGAEGVIEWIVVALFVALALDPAVRFLEARRLPRVLAVALVVASGVGLLAVLVGTLVPMLIEQGRSFGQALPDLLERLRGSGAVAAADQRLGFIARIRQELASRAGEAAGPVFRLVGGVLRAAGATVTIIVLSTFMLLFGGTFFRSFMTWVPPSERERVVGLVERIQRKVGGYLSGTLLVASIGGTVTAITLLALGVPFFLPLGLAMMLLGLVPFIGATIGGVLIVTTTMLTVGVRQGLVALVVFVLYQQTENHVLQPLVQRRTIQMNPLAIALVMLVGTAFAGVLGALLSLPLAAAAQIVLEDIVARRRSALEPAPEPQPPPAEPTPEPQPSPGRKQAVETP